MIAATAGQRSRPGPPVFAFHSTLHLITNAFTPLTVAVYVVEADNAAAGVNVAVFEPALYAEEPDTADAPTANENPTVADCTASENVADGNTDTDTPVAPANGDVADTVGGVVSTGGGPVVITTSTQ